MLKVDDPMPKIEKLFYAESKGTGTPIILIHGAAANHVIWSGELRRLEGRRVLAVDLLGHGRSEAEVPETIQAHVEALLKWMDALEIERAIFAGHSMGGAIAQQIALSAPTRCAGLILMATAAKLPVNPNILNLVRSDKQQVAEMINKWEWSPTAPAELKAKALARLLEVPAEQMYRDYAACNNFDISDRLAEITMPTLVISGELDKMAPRAWQEALVAGLPNATLAIIEQAGHYLILEKPQAVADSIAQWLVHKFPTSE
jgi:pimeloyl-ACP methyl ester carboxylesterase